MLLNVEEKKDSVPECVETRNGGGNCPAPDILNLGKSH